MQRDTLYLPEVQLPDGSIIKDEWCNIHGLNSIEAIYELIDGRITVLDHGVLGTDDDNTIMTEAPTHYLVMSGVYSGSLQLAEKPGFSFIFENNQLINIK